MKNIAAFVVALLLSTGTLSAQQDAGRLDGCYALSLGEWSAPWPQEWAPPQLVRLERTLAAEAGARREEWFALRPAAPLPNRRGGASFWHFIDADSIRLNWAGDYAGLNLNLAIGEDELQGWARGFTDVIRPASAEPRARVTARRVECPLELAD